ncbi:RING-H2 finger protein ATL79-like [Curcuma longa]|uniref:RING-H2 finger protein ATL79-like n=1 Tax=Curcuma longa TaxID=136217 RepID=UPI003D9E269A
MPSPSGFAATNSTWGPYTSGKDFGINMATVLAVLLGATALAFALHVAFRFLVRLLGRDRARAPYASGGDQDDKPPAAEAAQQLPGPVVSFSSGATRMAGAPERAICLAELEEGDRVRVLPPCGHGFHAQCVEAWFVGRSSCPTCCTHCRPTPSLEDRRHFLY